MELVELCHCQYDAESIKEESFVCFVGSEEYVTFRAQLSSTAYADSTTLLSLIEGWVSTGPTIRVSGILRRVDKDCPVAISDFSEGECVMTTTDDTVSCQSDSTAAIVGGSLGGVLVLVIMTTAIIIVLVMRNHGGKFNNNKAEE